MKCRCCLLPLSRLASPLNDNDDDNDNDKKCYGALLLGQLQQAVAKAGERPEYRPSLYK